MTSFPCLVRSAAASGQVRYRLGDPLIDRYLEFVAGRARPNTLRPVAFDLKTFFSVVARVPRDVCPADVFEFLADQRGDRTVVRLSDRESGAVGRQRDPDYANPEQMNPLHVVPGTWLDEAVPGVRRTSSRRASLLYGTDHSGRNQ
jgi:hypothetical protein